MSSSREVHLLFENSRTVRQSPFRSFQSANFRWHCFAAATNSVIHASIKAKGILMSGSRSVGTIARSRDSLWLDWKLTFLTYFRQGLKARCWAEMKLLSPWVWDPSGRVCNGWSLSGPIRLVSALRTLIVLTETHFRIKCRVESTPKDMTQLFYQLSIFKSKLLGSLLSWKTDVL